MAPATRSTNGPAVTDLTAAQINQLKAMCNNDQVLTDGLINLMKTTKANPAGPPVYDVTDKTFVHTYVDNDGNNQRVQLMRSVDLIDFYHDVLKFDDEQIRELKAEGLEYPRDFAAFDSESVEATIKSMRSKDNALGGLTQMQMKQFCDSM